MHEKRTVGWALRSLTCLVFYLPCLHRKSPKTVSCVGSHLRSDPSPIEYKAVVNLDLLWEKVKLSKIFGYRGRKGEERRGEEEKVVKSHFSMM